MAKQTLLLDKDPGSDITTPECPKEPLNTEVLASATLQDCPAESPEELDKELLHSVMLKETKAICQFTDIPCLLPILQSRLLVTGEEFLCLLNRWEQGFRRTAVGLLLEILPRKHPDWAFLLFESFQEEEEHQGHAYLVDMLRESVQQKQKLQAAQLQRSVEHSNTPHSNTCSCCLEYKKEIRRLLEENERLRKSLQKPPMKKA